MRPTHYTEEEGGDWIKWPRGVRMPRGLLSQTGVGKVLLTSPGTPTRIHALAFSNPAIEGFARWDCWNGWTNRNAKGGRKPRMSWDSLIAEVRRLRLDGASCKVIAQKLGYSPSYIQEVCIRHELKKQFKCKPSVAILSSFGVNTCGTVRPAFTDPAASEAKPSDTPQTGSHEKPNAT